MTYPFPFKECLLTPEALLKIGFLRTSYDNFDWRPDLLGSKQPISIHFFQSYFGEKGFESQVMTICFSRGGEHKIRPFVFLHELIDLFHDNADVSAYGAFLEQCNNSGFIEYTSSYFAWKQGRDLSRVCDAPEALKFKTMPPVDNSFSAPDTHEVKMLSPKDMDRMGLRLIRGFRWFTHPTCRFHSLDCQYPIKEHIGPMYLHEIMAILYCNGLHLPMFYAFCDLCAEFGYEKYVLSYIEFRGWRVEWKPRPAYHAVLWQPEAMDRMDLVKIEDSDLFRWFSIGGRKYSFPVMVDGCQYLHVVYDELCKKLKASDRPWLDTLFHDHGWGKQLVAYLASKKPQCLDASSLDITDGLLWVNSKWVHRAHIFDAQKSVLETADNGKVNVTILYAAYNSSAPRTLLQNEFEKDFVRVKVVEP